MVRRLQFGILALLVLIQAGCFYSGHHRSAPVDNVDFAVMKRLGELDGTYKDTSDTTVTDRAARYWESLSAIFWPPGVAGAAEVQVCALGDDGLSITSLDHEGRILKERLFAAGRDFEFAGGRIWFRKGNALLQDSNDAILGPDSTTIEFGIDPNGHVKVRRNLHAAGLVYAILPSVIRQTQEFRFQRIDK